ncbi:MAG: hypothetical protein CVU64_21370 [Deltaproteobacteria bacterium HGW-Deltaproteobacteria-21]|jgi:hypothetical protein|nr:MAG: hypothetical protein CVU64_21370 [Deltaproteobacteria bacterium HGW-Deltaproteobacteria-21]PKN62792.1 MAG: hypothetical protein CVU57_22640 [Deltaproteobacteria bacterium HGW-Deltaproteobacteria-15]
MQPNLPVVFLTSIAGVFVVLIFLAVIMEIIMRVFPAKGKVAATDDCALYSAIISTYAREFPGARIARIEEIKNLQV